MDPAAGMMVTENVRLTELLGEGGMGSVWIAEHLGLGTDVAVKFISASVARKNSKMVERFKREASIAASIKSPHVVQIFDHGVRDGVPYIVMELLEGESLRDRIRRAGALSLREASLLVSQVAQVLDIAHDLKVVHRDIKPANLFLTEMGYELFAKVLDFGIAKNLDPLGGEPGVTNTGAFLGSPRYLSPEQVGSAKDVDHRADLWSLAVVVFLAKFDKLGEPVWSQGFQGLGADVPLALVVEGGSTQGGIWMAGYFTGSINFGGGMLTAVAEDPFVAKFDGDGCYLWERSFKSSGDDRASALALAASGDVVVAGSFNTEILIGPDMHTSVGKADMYMVRLGPEGVRSP